MQQKEAFLAQKELEVKELRLQLVEKEQDLSKLEAVCNDIVLEAEKNDHIQAEIEAVEDVDRVAFVRQANLPGSPRLKNF